MATRLASVARQTASISGISSPSHQPLTRLSQRRSFAGAADHHGPPKVNCWEQPTNPGNWKEEHFVIVSLSGWGLAIFGGYKFFTRGKGKKEEGTLGARATMELLFGDPVVMNLNNESSLLQKCKKVAENGN